MIFLISGCDKSDSKDIKTENNQIITITVITKSAENPVFKSAVEGARAAAEKLSKRFKTMDVVIDPRIPARESAEVQAQYIRKAVADSTNAIVVSCSDKALLTEAINYAAEQGVPVVTFDSDAPESKRIAFIGSDDAEIGARLMDELAKQMDGQGSIAVLAGNIDAPNLKKRTAGIIDEAKKYPDIKIVGVYHHKETESDAIIAMLDAQKAHPDIQGWAMVGGWPLFGDKLLNVIDPGQYKIVAMDALPEQLPYIENGMVQVLLGQPTYLWGKKSVEMIVDKLYLDKEIPENNGLNFIPVSIDNLGGWSRQLRAWGFTDIPVKYLTYVKWKDDVKNN